MACGCATKGGVVSGRGGVVFMDELEYIAKHGKSAASAAPVYYAAYRWLGARWVGYPAPRLWLDRLGVTGPTGPLRWPTRLVVFSVLLLWKVLALLTWPVRQAVWLVAGLALAALDRTLPRGPIVYPGCGCLWWLKRWSRDPWAPFRVQVDRWNPKQGDALDRELFTITGDEARRILEASAVKAEPKAAPPVASAGGGQAVAGGAKV